jgi:hypothetical protein
MRVIVESEINMEQVTEEDSKILKDFSIHHKSENDRTIILGQKIDLEYDNIEIFLDIVYEYTQRAISLKRYSEGRYYLQLDV